MKTKINIEVRRKANNTDNSTCINDDIKYIAPIYRDMYNYVYPLFESEEMSLESALKFFDTMLPRNVERDHEEEYMKLLADFSYDYAESIAKDDESCSDWTEARNVLAFTDEYFAMFEDEPIVGLWIAYEALSMLFTIYSDHHMSDLQVFYWKDKPFYAYLREGNVLFLTGDEE